MHQQTTIRFQQGTAVRPQEVDLQQALQSAAERVKNARKTIDAWLDGQCQWASVMVEEKISRRSVARLYAALVMAILCAMCANVSIMATSGACVAASWFTYRFNKGVEQEQRKQKKGGRS